MRIQSTTFRVCQSWGLLKLGIQSIICLTFVVISDLKFDPHHWGMYVYIYICIYKEYERIIEMPLDDALDDATNNNMEVQNNQSYSGLPKASERNNVQHLMRTCGENGWIGGQLLASSTCSII